MYIYIYIYIHTHPCPPTPTHSTNPLQVDRGALRLDLLFASSLEPLGQAFEETGYKGARTDLMALRQAVKSEVGERVRWLGVCLCLCPRVLARRCNRRSKPNNADTTSTTNYSQKNASNHIHV